MAKGRNHIATRAEVYTAGRQKTHVPQPGPQTHIEQPRFIEIGGELYDTHSPLPYSDQDEPYKLTRVTMLRNLAGTNRELPANIKDYTIFAPTSKTQARFVPLEEWISIQE
jgi:hypothetical protein